MNEDNQRDAEQDRDAVQVQQKRERDAEQRVNTQKRRKPEEHAERERGGGPFGRVLDVQQPIEPPADQAPGEMDHRK